MSEVQQTEVNMEKSAGYMTVESALQTLLRTADARGSIIRGIKQCVGHLVKEKKAKLLIVSSSYERKDAMAVLETLAQKNGVGIVKVADSKQLAQLTGLVRFDIDNVPKHVMKCASVLITDCKEEEPEYKYLMSQFTQ